MLTSSVSLTTDKRIGRVLAGRDGCKIITRSCLPPSVNERYKTWVRQHPDAKSLFATIFNFPEKSDDQPRD